ncbi:hypothetical protein BDW22DRAFT_1353443 [Trametopsis cervina]|nr:hypothetical protein BDW22DRAFT_1353443 [Trametopsis cervina]
MDPSMSMSPMAGAGLNANNTIGALLLGGLVAAILYGITSMQTAVFYQQAHADNWMIKLGVPVLWCLSTMDIGLIAHFLYFYLINNFGNFGAEAVGAPLLSVALHFPIMQLTQIIVRVLFAARIRKLSHSSWPVVLFIYALSLADLAVMIFLSVESRHENFAGLSSDKLFKTLVCVDFGMSFAGDALVAIYLCYILQRSRVGFGNTESMLKTLAAYIITTGLLTTIVQSVALILFVSLPKSFVYFPVFTQVSKLYVNAYLAMLNDRDRIREKGRAVSINLSRFSNNGREEASGQAEKLSVTRTEGVRFSKTPLAVHSEGSAGHSFDGDLAV